MRSESVRRNPRPGSWRKAPGGWVDSSVAHYMPDGEHFACDPLVATMNQDVPDENVPLCPVCVAIAKGLR